MKSVLTVGLAPAFQKVLVFPSFTENEVNRCTSCFCFASGKAINVTRVLTRLGRKSVSITQLGGPRVEEFLSLARKEGIAVRYIPSSSATRTCTTVINEEKGTSTELVEEAGKVKKEESDLLYFLFLEEEEKHDAVIISGKKAEGYSDTIIPSIVKKSGEDGKLIVLDIRGNDLINSLPMRPSVIKPNIGEFCSTFSLGENRDLERKAEEKMRMLYDKWGVMSVITRGKEATWCYDGKEFFSLENTLSLPAVNTIGCGDTLTAVMTHHLLDGATLKEAVREGMIAAQKKAAGRTFDF